MEAEAYEPRVRCVAPQLRREGLGVGVEVADQAEDEWVAVRERENLKTFYQKIVEDTEKDQDGCASLNTEALTFEVKRLPAASEAPLDVDIDKVVELLSR